jgi:Zn-dependent protease
MGGTFRLFKFRGIQVYLHFTWFLVAAYEVQRANLYSSTIWAVYEYLALFFIVLLHEFGHALACRQTGGRADQIVLWPLGGIAFVDPPRRAGAVLWSIAAGPLVNVLLIPVFYLALVVMAPLANEMPNTFLLIYQVRQINLLLLIFNMLPVYPLDGGQILRALLWFPLGEIRSLQIASVLGLVGAVVLAGLALLLGIMEPIWVGVMAFFLISRAIAGWQYAKALVQEEEANRAARLVPTIPEAERPGL